MHLNFTAGQHVFSFVRQNTIPTVELLKYVFVSTMKKNLTFNRMFLKFRTTFDQFRALCVSELACLPLLEIFLKMGDCL